MTDEQKAKVSEVADQLRLIDADFERWCDENARDYSDPIWRLWQSLSTASAIFANAAEAK